MTVVLVVGIAAPTELTYADDISNNLDATIDAAAESMALVFPGAPATTTLYVSKTDDDGKKNCNLTGSTTLVVAVSSSSTSVATVSPSQVTFTGCGSTPTLTVTPVGVGTTTISVAQTSNNTGGTFNFPPATFSVNVTSADTTPPVITKVVTGTLGSNGWYTSNPTVTWTVTDPETAPVVDAGCGVRTFTTETAGVVSSCTAHSAGGSAVDSVNLKIDRSGPLAVLNATGTAGANGWFISNVAVSTTGSDSISGPVTCSSQVTLTAETAGLTQTGSCTNQAGLPTDAAPISVKIDKTGPSAALAVTAGTAGSNGWYTSDVTVTASGSDTISNLVTCSPQVPVATETGGTNVTGSCTNDAGLSTNATPLVVKLDKSNPTAIISLDGTLGANGWYTSDVVATTTGADTVSEPVTCTGPQNFSADIAAETVNGTCSNGAGLQQAADSVNLKIDQTAPTNVVLTVTAGAAGANGWYTSNVTVATTGTDPTSGVICTTDQAVTAEGTTVVTGECTNGAGLTMQATDLPIKLDKSGPSATLAVTAGTAGTNGWYTSNVTVATTGTDSISGPVTCTIDQPLTNETTGQAVNGTCTNAAGLTTNASPLTIKIDTTGPTAASTVTAGTLGTNGWHTTDITITTTGTDTISGPTICTDAQVFYDETTGLAVTGSCTNQAGLASDATPITIKIDKSGPTADLAVAAGTAGVNGWFTSDVTLNTTGDDDMSSPTVCTVSQVFTDETAGQEVDGVCINSAGLPTHATSFNLKIDRSGPLAVLNATGTAGANGWFISNVAVSTTGSDSISGPVTCSSQVTLTAETAGLTQTGSCTNQAGLPTDAAPISVKIDKTGPSAALAVTAGTAGSNGWYTSDVTVTASGSDTISNLVTCSPQVPVATETGGTNVTGSCTNDAGLSTNATPLVVKLDKSNPTAIISLDGTLGANGWYTSDVVATTTGADTVSEPVTCTGPQNFSADIAAETVNGTCSNGAGLQQAADSVNLKIDQTAPTNVVLTVTAGAAGANGWYTSNVTVATTGTDPTSGVICTTDQAVTAEGTTVVTGECTNGAGLTMQATDLPIKLDKSGPSATLAVTAGTAGTNGWYTSNVTVATTGTDSISGPVTCTIDQPLTNETTGQAVNGTCTNAAGLTTNASPLTIKIDTTGPTAASTVTAGTLGTNGWHTTDITITTTGTDTISGPTICTDPVYVDASTTGTVVNGSCTNDAGFTTNAVSMTVKLDKSPPTVTMVGGPAHLASYYFGAVPGAPTCSGSDTTSGLASCTVTGYGAAVGGHTVSVVATDRAGNISSESHTYTVLGWALNGFYQPVDMSGIWNTVRNGSTVPLKFEVFAGATELTNTSIISGFTAKGLTCPSGLVTDDIELTTTGGTSLRYDATGGQFIQNWQTPKGRAGSCYLVTVTTQDGSSISAKFQLK